MSAKFKIGIDYHGVINAAPRFFKEFNRLALDKGHEIHIISGGSADDIRTYLDRQKIPYTRIWSMVDYFKTKNQITFFPDGSFKVDDDLWNKAKGEYCRANGIDFHIDDSELYGRYFTTPFCLYDLRHKTCSCRPPLSVSADFRQTPQRVLNEILAIARALKKASE